MCVLLLKFIFDVSTDYAFLNYAPYLVAAACVASSRVILRLSPTWPTRLHRLTAYSWDFLVQCIERLLIDHDNDVKEANKQRGQAGPQPAQLSVFQAASQPSRAVHFQQPQYLHQTHQSSRQYRHPVSEQPSCQQIVSTTHTSSYTLPTCPAGFLLASGPWACASWCWDVTGYTCRS